ncbi:tail fiber protein [Flavobacterium sp.]|uniref:phage tail protein n=1 Tax=Flavobacterium sp. TaxID=239 RepID=UPI0032677E3C
MSTEPFVGEIKILGFNFAPRGYMTCQGQLLSIAQNNALFALLGTTYGGNGVQTFGLPNLQGRMPIGQGQGAGLPAHNMGEISGSPTVTILTSNMPAHIHAATGLAVNIPISTGGPDIASAEGAFLANTGVEIYSSVSTDGKNYGASTVSGNTAITGGSQPISIMNPYLVINYSIATEGIFPSRN